LQKQLCFKLQFSIRYDGEGCGGDGDSLGKKLRFVKKLQILINQGMGVCQRGSSPSCIVDKFGYVIVQINFYLLLLHHLVLPSYLEGARKE